MKYVREYFHHPRKSPQGRGTQVTREPVHGPGRHWVGVGGMAAIACPVSVCLLGQDILAPHSGAEAGIRIRGVRQGRARAGSEPASM